MNHYRQVALPGGPEGGQLWNYYVDGIASPREIELVALLLVNRADLVDNDKELKGTMRHLIGLFWDYDPRDGLESWEPPAVRTSGQALVDQVRGLVEGSVEDFHIGRIARLQHVLTRFHGGMYLTTKAIKAYQVRPTASKK